MVETVQRTPTRRPDLDTVYCINADGSRNVIHPASVRGRFQRRKLALWIVLIGIYLAIPWLKLHGNPVLLVDLPQRHFYLLGRFFDAQDFWLAFFFLTGIGFTLFVVSALWGRVWCGYACPQTVFLEGVFRRLEYWIDGGAQRSKRLADAPWSMQKLVRRASKHGLFIVVSLVLAHTLLGYFMPVEQVVEAVAGSPAEHSTAFTFILVLTGIIYFNFTWFREQLCIVICPYGRLQGALQDEDTVVVGYDSTRGEPRGRHTNPDRGACIDCFRCVAVCPTGIDIRNGTQLECIGCANCVDACDEVMDKLGQARGLVRYDSQRGFAGGTRRFWRGRVWLYAVLLAVGAIVFLFSASLRRDVETTLVRLPGRAYQLEDNKLRNSFRLHLVNKMADSAEFTIGHEMKQAHVILPVETHRLDPLEEIDLVVLVETDAESFDPSIAFELVVRSGDRVWIVPVPMVGPPRVQ